MYFSSAVLYNRFLPQTMGLALSSAPKRSAALKSCAKQLQQVHVKDSCPKVGWTGKETLQCEQHLVLGKWDGSARAVGVIRCLHINIQPSSGNHLQHCWESLGTAHGANGTRRGDWFLFLPFFPRVMENSCLKQL